jgi:pyrrolysine biosynthesis protein PylD
MTRLENSDICDIPFQLKDYDKKLKKITGKSLLGVASHAWGVDESKLLHQIKNFSIHVVPVAAGQGIIMDFSQTVYAILKFLGFNASVADQSDTSGIASAFEKEANAIMMADDYRFVGINLLTCKVVNNDEATGKVFAAALDLMTGGITDWEVLILGCGPVGSKAAKKLLNLGAHVSLYDIYFETALSLKEKLSCHFDVSRIKVVEDCTLALSKIPYILEATPSEKTIPDDLIFDNMMVSAPGVPLGISRDGCKILENRLIHDKLELGVAAMAVNLVLLN